MNKGPGSCLSIAVRFGTLHCKHAEMRQNREPSVQLWPGSGISWHGCGHVVQQTSKMTSVGNLDQLRKHLNNSVLGSNPIKILQFQRTKQSHSLIDNQWINWTNKIPQNYFSNYMAGPISSMSGSGCILILHLRVSSDGKSVAEGILGTQNHRVVTINAPISLSWYISY